MVSGEAGALVLLSVLGGGGTGPMIMLVSTGAELSIGAVELSAGAALVEALAVTGAEL